MRLFENKKEREKKDTFAQEEVIYRDQDFEKLYMESMRKMPNKFQEVISKLKGFFGKVKEKVIERVRWEVTKICYCAALLKKDILVLPVTKISSKIYPIIDFLSNDVYHKCVRKEDF